jgi:hypothetical protein
MACSCSKAKNRQVHVVKLPGGLKVEKSTEAAALAYSAKHPGSTVAKKTTA